MRIDTQDLSRALRDLTDDQAALQLQERTLRRALRSGELEGAEALRVRDALVGLLEEIDSLAHSRAALLRLKGE